MLSDMMKILISPFIKKNYPNYPLKTRGAFGYYFDSIMVIILILL